MSLHILPLTERPEFSGTCAAWCYGTWGCHMAKSSLEKSVKGYDEAAKNKDSIPLTWIGMADGYLAGMISLVEHDHDERKDLSPWLASMYVHPDFRCKKYASQLIQHLHGESKKLGYEKLYLFTPDMEELYRKNGWQIIGKVSDPRGMKEYEHLMEMDLNNVQ